MVIEDPWKKIDPFDPERLAEQKAGLDDYLAHEKTMTPLRKVDVGLDQFSQRHTAAGWGCGALLLVVAVTICAAWSAHGCM